MASIGEWLRDFRRQKKWEKLSHWSSLIYFILGVIVGIFSPSLYNMYLGYDLVIELQADLSDDGYSVIALSNEGGYPLHEIAGEMSFSCQADDATIFGSGKLEGYVDTLDRDQSKGLLFKDETLNRWINQTKFACNDVIAHVRYYEEIDEETTRLSKLLVFEYQKEGDKLNVIEIPQGENYFSYQCVRCAVNITINSSEEVFNKEEDFVFAGYGEEFNFTGDHMNKRFATPGLNFDAYDSSCYVGGVPCYEHICYKIRNDFDIPIDCQTILSSEVVTNLGENKVLCQIIDDQLNCSTL